MNVMDLRRSSRRLRLRAPLDLYRHKPKRAQADSSRGREKLAASQYMPHRCRDSHVTPSSALLKMIPSNVAANSSLGFLGLTVTAARFFGSFPTSFHVSPPFVLLKSPSRVAAYRILGSWGSTATPFTVRFAGRPPATFHPQKQSGLNCSPSAVPATRKIPPIPVEMLSELSTLTSPPGPSSTRVHFPPR